MIWLITTKSIHPTAIVFMLQPAAGFRLNNIISKFRTSMPGAADFIGLVSNVISVVSFFAPLLLPLIGFEYVKEKAYRVSGLSLPLRLLLQICIAAGLAWGLGFVLAKLTQKSETGRVVLAGFLSIVWAMLLIAAAESLTSSPRTQVIPEFTLFVALGMVLMLWILTVQLRGNVNVGNKVVVRDRALVVALFAFAAVTVGLLVRFGSAA